MARYAAETQATHVSDIDKEEVAARIVASAYHASAFMPGVSSWQHETRIGTTVKQGSKTWAAAALDSLDAAGSAVDETVYNPVGRSFTCTGHAVDTVISAYANIDGGSSGKDMVDQIVDEVSRGYATYFDSLAAALYTEAFASTNEVGTSATSLSGPLIDEAIEALLTAGAPEPYHLVIRTNKIRELMQIPGMRELAIRGRDNGGVGGPDLQRNNSALLVRGYGGVCDIYHTPEIDVASGTHNIMYAVGDGTNGAIVNPWVALRTATGRAPNKMWLEVDWNPRGRAVEVNATTIEVVQGRFGGVDANNWLVDVVTAPAS